VLGAVAACSASCSLLFDLSHYESGNGGEATTQLDGATGNGDDGTSSNGDAAGGDGGRRGTDGSSGGADAASCKKESEPNQYPGQASVVVPGENCGTISPAGDTDVWAFDQVGAGELVWESDTSFHFDLDNHAGQMRSINGQGPDTTPLHTGHYDIQIYSNTGSTG